VNYFERFLDNASSSLWGKVYLWGKWKLGGKKEDCANRPAIVDTADTAAVASIFICFREDHPMIHQKIIRLFLSIRFMIVPLLFFPHGIIVYELRRPFFIMFRNISLVMVLTLYSILTMGSSAFTLEEDYIPAKNNRGEGSSFFDTPSNGLSGEPIWIFDSQLYIKHVEVAELSGDDILDAVGGEYDMDYYGEPSSVYAVNGETEEELWTYGLDDGVRSMTAGDLNDDGIVDIVAGASYHSTNTPDGGVHAVDGLDGSRLWTYYTGSTNQDVTIGNFNGDPCRDVAVASFDDYVYAIDGETGEQLWRTLIGSLWVNAVAVGDVNDDGIDDVGFAHEYLCNYDNYLGVLDGTDGSVIWDLTVPYAVLDVLIDDIDDDGMLEAVFGGVYYEDYGYLFVRDALTGSLEWEYDLGYLHHVNGDINLHTCDIDDDSDADLIVGNVIGSYHIYAFDGDGPTPMWISEALDGYPRDIAFGDVIGDGKLNLVAATDDRVQVLEAVDGSKTWYYSVAGTISSVGSADFDGDGIMDVLAGGGAESSGYPPDPAKSMWALRTAESPVLWEFDFGEYGNALAINDLNGDPCMDVVTVCSLDDKAWAIDGETGTPLWSWTGTENLYTVTTGDFDGDEQIDVAVAGNDDMVTALDGSDGSVMWQFTLPSDQIYRKCLKAADLNGDGNVDVVAGSDDDFVYAINGLTGTVLWSSGMGGEVEEVELAQMNDAGPLDVVVAVGWSGNRMAVLDGSDGVVLWEYTQNTDYARHVEVFDVNDDGAPDVAIGVPKMGATPGRIIMVDGAAHTALWTVAPFLPCTDYGFAHGDLNGDGCPDLVAAGNSDDRNVHVFDGSDGEELWAFATSGDVNVVRVDDVNSDGRLDVLVGSDDQYVYVLNGEDGTPIWNYSTVGDVMDIRIGDISGDGNPNISCVTFDSDGVVYAFHPLRAEYILDDLDPEFHVLSGNWLTRSHENAHGGSTRFIAPGTGKGKSGWAVHAAVVPGTYDVYVWKFEHRFLDYMATDVRYRIKYRNGITPWIIVDQSESGNEWVYLTTCEFDDSSVQGILVTDRADGYVIADAVKLVHTGSVCTELQ
jgi:outer membrane protein assembly factor BamB